MRIPIRLTAFALLAACSSFASAAIVASTGFETTDTPAYPTATANLPTTTSLPIFDASSLGLREIRATGSPFGTGQYLVFGSGSTSGSGNTRIRANVTTPLTSIVFDLYEPTGFNGPVRFGFGNNDLNSTGSYTSWILNNGTVTAGNSTSLASGSLPSLSLDTVYRAHIYLNRSGSSSTVNYDTSSMTLNNNQAGLLFYDVANNNFIAGGVFNHTGTVSTSINFFVRNFSADLNAQVYIDNFERHDALVAVPEPSSVAAICVALAGGAYRIRRRRSKVVV